MSGIVGSRFNIRGSGLIGSLGTDGQVFTSSGAGAGAVYEDAAGGVNTPAFAAFLNTEQTISTATQTVITFNAELFDNGSKFNTSTYKWIPGEAGYYVIGASLGWSDKETINNTMLTILYDNNAYDKNQTHKNGVSDASWLRQSLSVLHYTAGTSTEYTVKAKQDSGSDVDIYGTGTYNESVCLFWGYKLIS